MRRGEKGEEKTGEARSGEEVEEEEGLGHDWKRAENLAPSEWK